MEVTPGDLFFIVLVIASLFVGFWLARDYWQRGEEVRHLKKKLDELQHEAEIREEILKRQRGGNDSDDDANA